MFVLNGTYVIFIGLFLAFIYLFNEIALKPVAKVIEERKLRIAGDYDAAKASNAEAEASLNQYKERIHAARMEAHQILHEGLNTANLKRDEVLKQLQEEGNKKIDAIRKELQGERKALLSSMLESEVELVKEMVDKLLGGGANVISVDRQRVQSALEEAS
jgi:F-type H+-transporting ATPase subunit b